MAPPLGRPARRCGRLATVTLLAAVVALAALVARPAAAQAFLQAELPLKPLVTTPAALLSSDGGAKVTLTGRQAITAVFSRPVIALGSDWGQKALPEELVPFTLSCGTPGRLRWVTTNIARFDPSVEWPTDLDCQFKWNTGLKSWDGVSLNLDGAESSVPLTTQPLEMTLGGVESEAASNATENLWSAEVGLPDDGLPEVPPGANVTLQFSYPVDLARLAAALELVPTKPGTKRPASRISILPCREWGDATPFPRPLALAGTPRQGTSPVDLLTRNATCAVVRLDPPLPQGARAVLRLPRGARYSALAGPARNNTDLTLYGLRRFRIPFLQDWTGLVDSSAPIDKGVDFRRLDMWLPHGLAQGVDAADLKPLASICRLADARNAKGACAPLLFDLSRPTKGKLRMAVPGLEPRGRYVVTVQGSADVKDAFGLPLQPSSTVFWSKDLDSGLEGPETANDVVLFEIAPGGATLTWPFVSRGRPGEKRTVQQWRVGASEVPRLVTGLPGYMGFETDAFGNADVSVQRSQDTSPKFQALRLPAGPGMSLVAACCASRTYPAPATVLTSDALVLQSNLQAVFIGGDGDVTAWVTDSQGGGGPVQGAKVAFYLASPTGQGPATAGPSCTTGADGTCTVDADTLSGARPSGASGPGGVPSPRRLGELSAFVTADGHGPLLVPQISTAAPYSWGGGGDRGYMAVAVLDRPLVKPGDDLHVTAFVQRIRGAQLLPPTGLSTVLVRVTPFFDPASQEPLYITADVDDYFGSVHIKIPVPSGTRPGDFSISIMAPSGPASQPAPDQPPDEPLPVDDTPTRRRRLQQARPGVILPSPGRVAPSASGYDAVGDAAFTVADPRPPTADLNVTAPQWVAPRGKVKVEVAAESYLGGDVGGAEVTLAWTLPKAKGNVTLVTDAKGAASTTIDLGALPSENATRAGDSLELSLSWVGPTQELIARSASVRIADGPVRVELSRSLDTDLPGVPFGVAAAAFSNADGRRLDGTGVKITIVPANTSAGATNCSSAQLQELSKFSCDVKAGDVAGGAKACQITLPCMGRFAIKACVGGSCSNVTVGRNATEWRGYPWNDQPSLTVLPDRAEYAPGSRAALVVQNPFWGPASALVVWGNKLQRKQKTFAKVAPGLSTLDLGPLGTECRGGCEAVVSLAVSRPAGNKALRSLPPVPRSKLFDPLMPHTPVGTATLTVPEGVRLSCEVAVSAAKKTAAGTAVLAPNATSDVSVRVKGPDGKALAGAQVTVVVVDKAILDLKPYPLQNISKAMTPSLSARFEHTTLDSRRATRGALNATFATLQRRLKLDPYLPLYTRFQPGTGFIPVWRAWGDSGPYLPSPSPVDVPDAAYLAELTTKVTKWPELVWGRNRPVFVGSRFGGAAGGMAAYAPAPMPAMALAKSVAAPASGAAAMSDAAAPPPSSEAATNGQAGGGGGAAALRLSGDFKTTPLFAVATSGADGVARFTFRAPPNLGTFTVRAYAASPRDGEAPTRYGADGSSVIVRRPLSLVPAAPRIVRSGDVFEAGAVVSAPGASGPVTVSVAASAAAGGRGAAAAAARPALLASGAGEDRKQVTVPAGGQAEVRFRFSARQVGNATLKFVASSGSGDDAATDALVVELPVLGRQGDVFVATSFAIRPNASSRATATRQEGLVLPKAENGTGAVQLIAGVGYLPAIQATYDAVYARVTAPLYRPSGPDALSIAVLPAVLALYRDQQPPKAWLAASQVSASLRGADDAAGRLTDATFGLMYSDPNESRYWRPERCDITLNAWAAWLVGQLDSPKGDAAYGRRWQALDGAAAKWRAALAQQLTKDAATARAARPAPQRYNDLDTLSWARLALGSGWRPEGVPDEVASDLAFSRLTGAWRNLTAGGQARVGLTLAKEGGDRATLAAILKSLQSSVRVGGRTAYVATAPGARASAGLSDNSLALALFVASGATPSTDPLVQKLAAHVSEGPARSRYGPLFVPVTGFDGALSARALGSYDEAANSVRPDVQLNATAASNTTRVQLLSAKFDVSNAGALKRSSTPWSRVPPAAALSFASRGSGEVSVAASLTFVPSEILGFPTYRGLWVQRAVQLRVSAAGEPTGSVVAAPLAATVTVSIQVTAPDDAQDVVVEALMPGGLEPLDPRVYGDAGAAVTCGFSEDEASQGDQPWGGDDAPAPPGAAGGFAAPPPTSIGFAEAAPGAGRRRSSMRRRLASAAFAAERGGGWWGIWPPWPVCPTSETLPAVVTFRYAFMRAGTHTVRFKAIAATPGTFVLPPVKAYVSKQPEVMGLSPGGKFTVCAARGASCDTADRPPAAAPKRCPADCSGNGVCNLASGACICDAGFAGKDCAALAVA